MKIFVLCNEKGEIHSLAVPHPEAAEHVTLLVDEGRVHELEVDPATIDEEALRGPDGERALRKIFETLREMIRD